MGPALVGLVPYSSSYILVIIIQILLQSVAWQPNFDKQISSQERGGGVRGVEQWIRMATDYNYYLYMCIPCHTCSH